MTEEKLFETIEKYKALIDPLVEERNLSGLYELCHDSIYKLLKSEDESLNCMFMISEAAVKETEYRQSCILDVIKHGDGSSLVSYSKDLVDEISLALLRIDNDLPEDLIIEGLQPLAEKDISGDMIIAVADSKTRDPQKVLKLVAEAFKEINPMTSLTILRYLVDDHKTE